MEGHPAHPGQDRLYINLSGQTFVQPVLGALSGGEPQPATPAPVLSAAEKLPSTYSSRSFLHFKSITPCVTPGERGGLVYLLPRRSSG